ncbi:MAG: DUF6165 family protein [Alphaproteobacteria bacterium]|nr:DUF6165 family protein [Alphaproteobacteria bacterium]
MKNEEITVPISSGELIDKISILKIKRNKIANKSKLKNINKELSLLNKIYKNNFKENKKLFLYEKKLININKKLWDIEDKIRLLESKKNFNKEFIELARAVYINNDERSQIKKKINQLTGSNLKEEKSYKSY